MSFQYLDVGDAIARPGLRMVVVGKVPSPWGEAAKGIFHIKRIDWTAVRLVYDDDALKEWAGQRSGPVAMYDDELPRSGWQEILELAERLTPNTPLLPQEETARAKVLALAEKFCGKGGLGWTRRLQLVHAGLRSAAAGSSNASPAISARSTAMSPRPPLKTPRVCAHCWVSSRRRCMLNQASLTTSAKP